jgi:hypothetical protein
MPFAEIVVDATTFHSTNRAFLAELLTIEPDGAVNVSAHRHGPCSVCVESRCGVSGVDVDTAIAGLLQSAHRISRYSVRSAAQCAEEVVWRPAPQSTEDRPNSKIATLSVNHLPLIHFSAIMHRKTTPSRSRWLAICVHTRPSARPPERFGYPGGGISTLSTRVSAIAARSAPDPHARRQDAAAEQGPHSTQQQGASNTDQP